MNKDFALEKKLSNKQQNKLVEQLLGLITGLMADGTLNDPEIKMLDTWLTANQSVAEVWPGSDIWLAVKYTLRNSTITEDDRAILQENLKTFTTSQFSETGSVSAEVVGIDFDEICEVNLYRAKICLTGTFMYGDRSECEAASVLAGATPSKKPAFKSHYLIVGTNVSPDWLHTSFGLKIQDAVSMQKSGSDLKIITEARWLAALNNSRS
jgi:hypothetical protein